MSEQPAQRRSSLSVRLLLLTLVAICISGNFTNYGGIQSVLHTDLQTTDQTIGLLSTMLYLGIAGGYVAGGLLVDRFGPRRVLIAALLVIGVGNGELSLMPTLTPVLLCRLLVGLGAGVAGSQTAARLPGRAAPLGQGLFGGGNANRSRDWTRCLSALAFAPCGMGMDFYVVGSSRLRPGMALHPLPSANDWVPRSDKNPDPLRAAPLRDAWHGTGGRSLACRLLCLCALSSLRPDGSRAGSLWFMASVNSR